MYAAIDSKPTMSSRSTSRSTSPDSTSSPHTLTAEIIEKALYEHFREDESFESEPDESKRAQMKRKGRVIKDSQEFVFIPSQNPACQDIIVFGAHCMGKSYLVRKLREKLAVHRKLRIVSESRHKIEEIVTSGEATDDY